MRFHFYICGDSGPWDEYNPFYVLSLENASLVIEKIIEKPSTIDEIVSELNISEREVIEAVNRLLKIKAIRVQDEVLEPNFIVLFKEDVLKIATATKPLGFRLAQKISGKWDNIGDKLAKIRCAKSIDLRKIAYAVIGAYILDLKGLTVLEEEGLAICGEVKPGNRCYTLYGREKFKEYRHLIDGLFWGCHSSSENRVEFYSFGDHTGSRFSLPDVELRKILRIEYDEKKLRKRVAQILLEVIEDYFRIEDVETSLDKRLVNLLIDMDYITLEDGDLCLRSPIFIEDDQSYIDSLVKELKPTIKESVTESYKILKNSLRFVTPMRKGYNFGLVYIEIWHWIFGYANKFLAEKGYIYNPQRKKQGEARYMAWIHKG